MLPNPLCPLLPLSPLAALAVAKLGVAKVTALQATVLLLLTQLIKARIQIKAFSALGITLLLIQTVVFLCAASAAAAATAFAFSQRRSTEVEG
ncbi:MAG: ABC-2 family transporter protein [Prochlorococcaceae cyanobacterium]